MTPPLDRLIFFGTDAFSLPSLIRLLTAGYHITGVVTKPDSTAGRGRTLTMPEVKRLALASNIPVLQPPRLSEATAWLTNLKPSAGIVVAYGKIIPTATLSLFPKGLVNVHASLLPRWRGAAPIESALLEGDGTTGVTLMKLDPSLDTGPTYDSAKIQLNGTETRLQLYEQLAELGADLLAAKLPAILDGTIVPIPQDNSRATYATRLTKSNGQLDFAKPATLLEREIRAYLGWPGSRTTIAGTDITVTKAHTTPSGGPIGTAYRTPNGELAVHTTEGSFVIDELTPAGKHSMSGPAFLAGHPLTKT